MPGSSRFVVPVLERPIVMNTALRCRSSLATAAIVIAMCQPGWAGTYTLTSNFDNTFNDSLVAPYVGTASLSYTNGGVLGDGVYSWSSLVSTYGLTYTASFLNGQTFTGADLQTPGTTNIYIYGDSFVFTSLYADAGGNLSGSADFTNSNNYIFSGEPLYNSTYSQVRGPSINSPMYYVSG